MIFFTTFTLLNNGSSININWKNEINEQRTPLHVACEKGNIALLELLCLHGADVNVQTTSGFTPLHYFVEKNQSYGCIALILKGSDWTIKNIKEQSAMDIALSGNYRVALTILRLASEAKNEFEEDQKLISEGNKQNSGHSFAQIFKTLVKNIPNIFIEK